MKKLKDWLTAAFPEEIKALAKSAGTSPQHLVHVASGRRNLSAQLAGRIETAAGELRAASEGRLPPLTRADICRACHQCPYAQASQE